MAGYRSYLFPAATVGSGFLVLDSRESHHLVRVLRARSGEAIEVLDGRGRIYVGRIERADAKGARIEVDVIREAAEPKPRITLIQSIPKGKTMDLILRMATEIGVSVIQPIFTDQGEVQMKGDRLRSKVEKWEMVMIESCKQCGLSHLPELGQPMRLSAWLDAAPGRDRELRVVASLEAGSRPLIDAVSGKDAWESIVIAVGPEGDFTTAEYAGLRAASFKPVRLGSNVLRSETAAAYILSVVDQHTRGGAEG